MAYLDIFKKETKLIDHLGLDKAHIVWVMARYLEEADVAALAATALTDGPDDKKIDFIYLDRDNKRIVLTQGFLSNKAKDSAPANKASDLNTAAAWLFSGDISTIPETRWIPVIDVILPLITADPDIQKFPSSLSDEAFHSAAAKKVNALLQAMKASEKLTSFAVLISDS